MVTVTRRLSFVLAALFALSTSTRAQTPTDGARLQTDDQALAVCDAVLFVGGHNNGVSKPIWKRPLTFGERHSRTFTEVHEVSLRVGKNAAPSRVFQITEDASSPMPRPWWVIPRDDRAEIFLAKLETAKAEAKTRNAADPLSDEGRAVKKTIGELAGQSRHPNYTLGIVKKPIPVLDPGTTDPLAPALYDTGNTEFFRGGSYFTEMITFKDHGYVQAFGSGREVVFRLGEDGELEALCWQPTTSSEFYTITNSD